MHINELPDEILALILDMVGPRELPFGAALVSRRWRALAASCVLAVRSAAELEAAPRAGRALLVPAGLEGLRADALLSRAALLMPRLAALTVHVGLRFSSDDIGRLAQLLPGLRHLDVFTEPDVSLAPAAARLRSLVVNGAVASVGPAGGLLRALHMYGSAQHYPRRELLALLKARGDHLTELTLRCTELGAAAYGAVGRCPALVALRLYSCWLMRRADALAATRPPRLRRLHVTGAVLLRSEALGAVLARLPRSLEELVLSGGWLGDEHAARLRLPRLRVLEAWRVRLSAAGALRLARAAPRLRVLDLDLALRDDHVAALRAHPALEFLRCLPGGPAPPAGGDVSVVLCGTEDDAAPSVLFRPRPSLDLEDEASTTAVRDARSDMPIVPGGSEDEPPTTPRESECELPSEPAPFDLEDEAPPGPRPESLELRVESTAGQFPGAWFRSAGEGFRGKLFYYWTPPLQLRPLENDPCQL